MNETAEASSESKHDFLEDSLSENSFISIVELFSKLKTVTEKLEQLYTERQLSNKNESDKGRGREKPVPKHKARAVKFEKRTTILESENDSLSKDIDVKPENSNDQNELGGSKDEERDTEALKTEYLRLREVCKQIAKINKEWQNYNEEVQLYIRELEEAVQADKPQKDSDSSEKSWANSEESDTKRGVEDTDTPLLTHYNSLLEEASRLRKDLKSSKRSEELLKKELEKQRLENLEHIALLKRQLSIYKEDYKAEKREKTVAQTTSSELSKELLLVRERLREYKIRLNELEKTRGSSRTRTSHSSQRSAFSFAERESSGSTENGYLRADNSEDSKPSKDVK